MENVCKNFRRILRQKIFFLLTGRSHLYQQQEKLREKKLVAEDSSC